VTAPYWLAVIVKHTSKNATFRLYVSLPNPHPNLLSGNPNPAAILTTCICEMIENGI